MKVDIKKYITKCTLAFKAFHFDVTMSAGRASLWNFTCYNPSSQKKYAVYCAPDLSKVKSLIKIALRKLPPETRLVVVTQSYTDEDLEKANKDNYCLTTIDVLDEFGTKMLDLQSNASESKEDGQKSDQDTLVDDFLSQEGIFKG